MPKPNRSETRKLYTSRKEYVEKNIGSKKGRLALNLLKYSQIALAGLSFKSSVEKVQENGLNRWTAANFIIPIGSVIVGIAIDRYQQNSLLKGALAESVEEL